MSFKSSLREIAAHLGISVSRQATNPQYTLVGLRQMTFGTVLDVGANVGQFAREARRLFPTAELHCFEPTPSAFEHLTKWCQRDGNAHAIKAALGDERGLFEMNVHLDHTPSSSLLRTTRRSHELYPMTEKQVTIKVPVARLDDYVSCLVPPPARDILVKLDVQGYELPVLRGATDTLARAKACIIEVSLDPLYEGQARFPDVVNLVDAAGLRYAGNMTQTYAADGHVIYLDSVFVR